ncbi:MAG TPA: hypothetical protein VE690_05225 [Rhodopila sp.]|nr:hypothetical protein [Rhodopila sp.]
MSNPLPVQPIGVRSVPSQCLCQCLVRRRSRWLVLAVLALLSGCGQGDLFGPGRNVFPPQCPQARLIPSLSDLTRYAGAGPAHDLTDMVLQARVMAVDGSCSATDDKTVLPTKVRITISVQRGPAMTGRQANVPVFLAVAQGDEIRDKQVYPVQVTFPPNVDRVTMTSPDIALNLPIRPDASGASYALIAGFQLTPDELNANRHAGR